MSKINIDEAKYIVSILRQIVRLFQDQFANPNSK